MCLKLSHSDRNVDTAVLVQEGAPNKLLLGTDVQPKLGFALVAETAGKLVDLLTWEECPREEQPTEESSPCGDCQSGGTQPSRHDSTPHGDAQSVRQSTRMECREGQLDSHGRIDAL